MPVLNESDIKKYLRNFAEGDQRLGDHMIAALFGPLKNDERFLETVTEADPRWNASLTAQFKARSTPWQRFVPPERQRSTIRHIADWIKSAMINNEDWLSHTDNKGVPDKLRAIRSVNEAHNMANVAMLLTNAQMNAAPTFWAGREEIESGHIEIEQELADGYRIVRMKTPEALDRESALLNHCVGHGAYDSKVEYDPFWAYYSLRDRNNNPHVTFEVETTKDFEDSRDILRQCKGAADTHPVEKYFPHIQAFIEAHNIELEDDYDEMDFGMLGGHSVLKLPRGFTSHHQNTIIRDIKTPFSLPEGMTVNGNLMIYDSPGFTAIPAGLKVTGYMVVARCPNFTTVPEGLMIPWNLSFYECPALTGFAKGLRIAQTLKMEKCPNVTAVPEDMQVRFIEIGRNTFTSIAKANESLAGNKKRPSRPRLG